MCTQTMLHVQENLCTVLIPLCKNNLNLPVCSSFFFCLVSDCLLHLFIILSCLLPRCTGFFFFFYRRWFCIPVINQISLSQSKGWFPFILLCRWEKYPWTGPLGLYINYTNRISELYQHMYSLRNYLNVINIG